VRGDRERVSDTKRLLRWWQAERASATERNVTFDRGDAAIAALERDATGKRALWFGDAPLRFEDEAEVEIRDEGLNDGQRQAVQRAVEARDALLIHGPPGTGKTRTLVEIVRQRLRRRQRILVTAASNVAVDNIARRLAAQRVKVLRLGPAELVAPDLRELSFHHRIASLDDQQQAQKLFAEAQRIVDGEGRQPKNPRQRISQLRREAHSLQNLARATVMRRARVVCATAGGVDSVPLGDEQFDLVVLDEATQAPDPVALAAILRGGVVVLAGDPQQLPPTVVTDDAEARAGLSSTFFERCSTRWPPEATVMLTTQYRMSEALMRFPSQAHYEGQLIAAEGNRGHRLADLVTGRLSTRDGRAWIMIDSSELGIAEAKDGDSVHNPTHRRIVAAEIDRLIASGIAPADIATICPYSAQANRLRRELRALVDAGLEIGTVDGFQGREKEVVIFDMVRSNRDRQIGFLRDMRRTNVALTRAKRQLVVVVHAETVRDHDYYGRLLAAAGEAGAMEQAEPA
jgi:ATP-dependent RNA/DNA helicase IGHMBP2